MDALYDVNNPENSTVSAGPDPVLVRKRVKRSYGSATSAMLIQLAVTLAVTLGYSFINGAALAVKLKAEHPEFDQMQLTAEATKAAQEAGSSFTGILFTFGGAFLGLLAAVLIGHKSLGAFSIKDSFNKDFRVKLLPLGLFSIMAIQPVAIVINALLVAVTGSTGMPEELAQSFELTDDIATNILILSYVCVIAPIMEELLYRGFILNALSPVDRKFAVIVSACLFSLMHGNFMQFPNTLLVGLLLGYTAVRSGSIIPSILTHIVLNVTAMVMSLVGEKGGETAMGIFLICEFVLGLVFIITYLKKNGKINNETDGMVTGYRAPLPAESANTVKLLFSCPSFWIVVVYYLFNAVVLLVASMAPAA